MSVTGRRTQSLLSDQFDVCRNPGASRKAFPYFVGVQSNAFERPKRRLVVPLTADLGRYPAIAPVVVIRGKKVVADTVLIFSIPLERLGPLVTSIVDEGTRDAIFDAIDRVTSRAYGATA